MAVLVLLATAALAFSCCRPAAAQSLLFTQMVEGRSQNAKLLTITNVDPKQSASLSDYAVCRE